MWGASCTWRQCDLWESGPVTYIKGTKYLKVALSWQVCGVTAPAGTSSLVIFSVILGASRKLPLCVHLSTRVLQRHPAKGDLSGRATPRGRSLAFHPPHAIRTTIQTRPHPLPIHPTIHLYCAHSLSLSLSRNVSLLSLALSLSPLCSLWLPVSLSLLPPFPLSASI